MRKLVSIIICILCLFSGTVPASTDRIIWGPFVINGTTYYDAFDYDPTQVSTVSANGPAVSERGHLNKNSYGLFFWGPINEHFCRDAALTDCPYGYDSSYVANGNGSYDSVPILSSTQDIYDYIDITLVFAANVAVPYQLTINLAPQVGGTVTSSPASDFSCSNGTCQGNFSGDVTLEATPADGWSFGYWDDGANQSTDNPVVVTMDAAKMLTAVFHLLSFPLSGYTPYTAPVSVVFDHSGNTAYSDSDHQVITFVGEASDVQTPYPGTTCYPKVDSSIFGSGFNYVGYGQNKYYLCYNGHPGYDYAVNLADVQSAASGTVRTAASDSCFGNYVVIDHSGGYATKYFHLASIDTANVQEDYPIGSGVKIGVSGNTGTCSSGAHLHFQVEKDGVPVDPYGWTGSGADPYTAATNDVLWK